MSFAAYGALAPTTYRATARIVLKPNGTSPLVLPLAPPPDERLRSSAIDDETIAQAGRELVLESSAATKARLDAAFEVTSPSPNTFELTFADSTAEATARVANLLARHAATRAAKTFATPSVDVPMAGEAERAKRAAELAAYVAAHPELTPGAPIVAPVSSAKSAIDREIPALRAERDQIQQKLAHLPDSAQGSDNPFGEPADGAKEATRLRRRIAEIEQTLNARKRAERKTEAAPTIAPEVQREWKRLVEAVAVADTAGVVKRAPGPTFTVLLTESAVPTTPAVPDRHALALYGAVAALLTALVVGIVQPSLRRRTTPAKPATVPGGSEPPRPGSEPPRPASEPPRVGSEPPRPSSEPPRVASEPPRVASEPPRPSSDPPKPAANPPRPILGVGNAPQRGSSNPPPERRPSSDPPPARATSSNPPQARPTSSNPPQARPTSSNPPPAKGASSDPAPARTATGHAIPSPPPQPVVEVSYAPASPLPPAPQPSPARPTPGYEELRHMPAAGPVPKGTLVGMAPVDPRALDKTVAASAAEVPPTPTPEGPFLTTPSTRSIPPAPGSTMRPPPPDGAAATVIETATVVAEVLPPEAPQAKTATPAPPEPAEGDNTWTGPSRAHRRTVSARRTTQILGSTIAPVVRGGRTSGTDRPEPTEPSTPAPASRSNTRYSYVTPLPAAPPQRTAYDTPPYFPEGGSNPRYGVATPSQRSPSGAPNVAEPAKLTKFSARAGWGVPPTLRFESRRPLGDQLFPMGVGGCFVIGVSAVTEARDEKSRVAAEIGLALAEPRHPRVLLLEADFQRPLLHQTLGIEMPFSKGFSQQLRAQVPGQAKSEWSIVECTPTLHVLAEGMMRAPGLILSIQFEESVRSLRTYYDFIVIDGPLASAPVDCRALSSVIDGIVIIAPEEGSPEVPAACALFPEKAFSTVIGV